jgi:hypothetical protein
MTKDKLCKLSDNVYYLRLKDSGSGQTIHAYVAVERIRLSLLEHELDKGGLVDREMLARFGTVIGWDYGMFPTEATRHILQSQYGVTV